MKCECSKCGTIADSQEGRKHRRCGGKKDAPIRDKHQKLESKLRGTWLPIKYD